ncbi:SDR family oxidoreductase [Methyloversatilis thermotolerans]|uniref:SDR family oxidoreductase n=1 Tax=Methyloversatilis thermotolerans TaxID=1346290 RepID=UPI000364F237|nr:SDR family oxidoreductase [Methyloversatilis thermotolerans]
MIVITGASGQLGRLVIQTLLDRGIDPASIVAAVRNPARVADLAARGVLVREADYDRPATLLAAFRGARKLLLISSSEIGRRVAQHRNAIEAAREVGVGLIAYTSLLHADRSPLGLAGEHRATEQLLRESGLPAVILRNGWYTENYLASVPAALQHGVFIGCAADGRIASAARADYAEAAAAVLLQDGQAGKVYELAGDDAYTLADFAAELGRQAGRAIPYVNLSEADFLDALLGAGLPQPLAELLADSDTGAAQGALFDDGRALSTLIGRPTTPLAVLMDGAVNG